MARDASAGRPRRGRPRRTPEERAEQRATLIGATIEALRAGGPELSLDELAAAAGVSKPTLYNEFGDKVGLADAIAVHLADGLEREVLGSVRFAADSTVDGAIEPVIHAVIEALIDLILAEPALYAFIVRAMRANDRGLLDNALVRVIQQRATVLVRFVAPDVPASYLHVLVDGLFGFVLAAVESWQDAREPARDELVRALTVVIRNGIQAVVDDLADPA